MSLEHIRVDVEADASKDSVEEVGQHLYAVSVCAKPERGEANKCVLGVMRRYLGPSVRVIKIVSGHHAPRKTILIEKGN